ncbi:MAG: hypothetical protein HQ446_01470 [Polaromonas sp.]|nr:hypothetical protein [Polaromonas sp.]
MDDFNEWDFASEFTPEQAALLIEGKYAEFSTGENAYLYQEKASPVILESMERDYIRTHKNQFFQGAAGGPWQSRPSMNKLPSTMMKIVTAKFSKDGLVDDLRKWLHSQESKFSSQKFTREDIQYWIDLNKFQTKYQFIKEGVSTVVLALNDEKVQASRWPWGNHHTELLGHLEAAACEFWIGYDPENAKTTAPKNEAVVAWLETNRKVSNTMAKAIASMLRPNDLPTGPRK